MKEEQIKEFIKYGRFIIHLVLAITMIILALFLFRYSNTIYTTLSRSPEFVNVEVDFYYLFLFMILLLVIPFTAFFILAVIELSQLMGQLKSRIIEQQAAAQSSVYEEDEELSEEEKARKEEVKTSELQKKYEKLEADIRHCLKENVPKVKEHKKISESVLSCIAQFYEITQGELYLRQTDEKNDKLVLSSTYAFFIPEEKIFEFEIGEGLIGQVAKQGEPVYLDNIPEGYITVASGLGSATPNNMIIFPIKEKKNKNVIGVIEIASFKTYEEHDVNLFKNLGEEIGKYFEKVDLAIIPE